ncbi:AI-2E family transporter [Haloparvum sedimenti]|uniref:AI-2E family transporter n=1 Tax=Haloparvum sedimenti TaxID=1678448 RepID=UPI00071E8454|nr:AI-2E family transporter [Haloparvum sedimenti]
MNRGQAFLIGLLGTVALLTAFVVFPFIEYVIAACILAYVLYPLHWRLRTRVGGMASALALVGGTVGAVVVPLAYIGVVFVREVAAIADRESDLNVAVVEERILGLTGREPDLEGALSTLGRGIAETMFGGVGGFVASAAKAGIGVGLSLFLLYYLLREGPAFVAWLRDLIPLPDRVTDALFAKVDAATWGVVVGHISVAIGQALIAGVGFWLAGVPDAVFWTFMMAVLALLPLIGAFLVWGPAAAYLALVGEPVAAALLAAYCLTVVSLFDNYARPIVIDQRIHINPGVILVGVAGGIYAVGFTGLFVGPIVIGVFVATLETVREDYDRV